VEAALQPLLRPGTLVPATAAGTPETLLVVLEPTGPASSRLRLTDVRGEVKLERPLTVSEGEGNKDCAALAQTAALIVERYLIQLDYRPPPPPVLAQPPPAPGRWDLSAASVWLPGATGVSPMELGARVGRQLGGGRRFVLALGARVAGETNPVPMDSAYRGRARQRRVPVDLGLWWRMAFRSLDLQAGGGAGLDITRTTSEGDPGTHETRTLPGPVGWLAGAVQVPVGSRFFARLSSAVYGSVVQYDFSYRNRSVPDGVTAFTTPTRRFYSRLGLEAGVVLP
jgi:hypothetical protein